MMNLGTSLSHSPCLRTFHDTRQAELIKVYRKLRCVSIFVTHLCAIITSISGLKSIVRVSYGVDPHLCTSDSRAVLRNKIYQLHFLLLDPTQPHYIAKKLFKINITRLHILRTHHYKILANIWNFIAHLRTRYAAIYAWLLARLLTCANGINSSTRGQKLHRQITTQTVQYRSAINEEKNPLEFCARREILNILRKDITEEKNYVYERKVS